MLRKNRSASLKSAIRPVLEILEERRLMAATLTLVNPEILPSSDRVIFNTIQNLDPTVPNVVHNQQVLQITDTGSTPLVISSIALTGPWAFVNAPAGGYTNVTVNPGAPLSVTLKFIQSTLPSHSYNETNYTTAINGGAAIFGSMTISSNDAVTPSKAVTLAGYWQNVSNNNEEPSFQTIVNLLAGYTTNINPTPIPDLSQPGGVVKTYGEEVLANSWEVADGTQKVTIQQIDAFHTEGNTAQTYWYSQVGQVSHSLFTTPGNQGQTLLPTQTNNAIAKASFAPTGAFGFRVDGEYSNDAINLANNNSGGGGHHFRFYPLRDVNGNYVPNTYIMAMDYGVAQAENFDFQDNAYIVNNIRPSGTPGTPTNLTATNGAAPVLTWTAVNYSPVAYNVYRSTSANGTYTKLTATPITTTTFTDSSSPIGTVYYRVTAIDATQNPAAESTPASVIASGGITLTAPVGQPYTSTAFTGQSVTFNPLVGVTDATGTILPNTVAVTTPNHGGTAVVNPASGLITYTPAAGFVGTETFSYTVKDSNNLTSAPAVVSFAISAPVVSSPISNNFFTTTLAGTPVNIPILSVDLPVTTFNLATLAISQGAHGTVSKNPDGTVTYTPNATFIGGDAFTYTIADQNGQVTPTATVDINVGVEISSAKGAAHSVVYPATLGLPVTVSLNRGVADIFFDGSGTVVSNLKGKIIVNGTALRIRDLALLGTTTASTLSITSSKNTPVNLGAVTDSSPLGALNARFTTLAQSDGAVSALVNLTPPVGATVGTQEPAAGTLSLAGVRSIILGGASSSLFVLGGNAVAATSLLVTGAVTDSNLTSTVALNSVRVGSWMDTSQATQIAAPSIGTLIAGAAGFQPNLILSGTNTSKPTLASAVVFGSLGGGSWNVAGTTRNVVVGATGASWNGTFGNLGALTVRGGGLPADVTATGTIGSLIVVGDLTGNVNAVSAQSVRVTGAVINASLNFTAPVGKVASLNSLVVAGAFTGSTLFTGGNVNLIVLGSLVNSSILVNTTATNVGNATAADIGGATLRSLNVRSKAALAFSDSNVIADVIVSATTGQVNETSSVTEGLAAAAFKNLAIGSAGGVIHLPAKDLINQATLNAYLTSKGIAFGTFKIKFV